ncbi:MAG: hypothetical protein QOG82_1728 [Actinomycetota bacterium]|nr:hypothetical protein [Actinomycetota bacterium]
MVLLVLAVVWAAVLIPPALRARQEGRPSDSISNFRRQLAVLRRTGPKTRGSADHWARPYASPSPTLASVSRLHTAQAAGGRPQPYLAPSGGGPTPGRAPVAPGRPRTSSSAAARSRTLRRRRDVLTGLAATVVVTLLLAVVTSLASMFVLLHLLADVLLIAYVALLIHQRNQAAAREMNVRFLPNTGTFDPSLMPGEPALLRRSAN